MIARPSLRDRPPRAAGACLLCCLLLAACSGGPLSFSWMDDKGARLSFSQTASFPRGKEGVFGPGRTANDYVLAQVPKVPAGYMAAVELELKSDGLKAGLALSSERRPKRPTPRFALPKGRTTIYLDLPAKGPRTLSIVLSAAGDGSPPPEGPWGGIVSVGFAPEFHGIDGRKPGELRLSTDFSSGADAWSFETLAAAPARGVPALVLAWSRRVESDIRIGAGAALRLRAAGAKLSSTIPAAVLGSPQGGRVEVKAPAEAGLQAAFVEGLPAAEAEAVDLGVVLLLPPLAEGADFGFRSWDLLPKVLVFDFRTYALQDLYLKRIAFFVEKRGFAGKLASDAEIASLHGWNAHDYKAEDLASFFSVAARTGFELNPQEERLRGFLLEKGLIRREGGGFSGSEGALISISQESPAYLRRLFLTHESLHALFFADEAYRKAASSVWESMSKDERWFWRLYFGWMNYNTGSDYLMANEVQAYLVQQPVAGAAKYFTETLPGRLLEKHPELEGELRTYFARFGEEFPRKAAFLDSWLRKRYGFGAGSTLFLR